MRIELRARCDRDEVGDVFDQGLLNIASVFFAEERRRGPGLRGVGFNRFDECILQPMQIFSRFDNDSCQAIRRIRDVVVLERLQRPREGPPFVVIVS